jgi:hypothetical protein
MENLIINGEMLVQFFWVFVAGVVAGGLFFYSSGKRKAYQEAMEQANREATAQAFAQYINTIAKGETNEQPS